MKERRRTLTGRVLSDKMEKTVVVSVERTFAHPLYHKVVKTSKRYKAHDAESACHVGDLVIIREARPLSREKRWIVETIVERADR
jgi:small subunit ribosomal protein S17